MLTAQERYALLDSAEDLYAVRDFRSVAELLAPIPESEILDEPNLAVLLASSWAQIGRQNEAAALLREIERICNPIGNTHLNRRCYALKGNMLIEAGDLAQAEVLLHQLVADSYAVRDQLSMAVAVFNLGVIANIRGEWSSALAAYERAAASFYRLGRSAFVGASHHNKAMVYRQLGLYSEADTQFGQALDYATSIGSQDEIAMVEVERAVLFSLMGDQSLAMESASRALVRARLFNNRALQGEALRVIGMIQLSHGRQSEAAEYLNSALEIARETSSQLLEAEVLEEIAKIHHRNGEAELGSTAAKAACSIYQRMNAKTHVERLAQWLKAPS